MQTLEKLPVEILENIFSYLSSCQDIIALTEVCHLFNDVISNNDKLVGKLILHIKYPSSLQSFSLAMQNSSRRYRKISISRSREYTSSLEPSPDIIFQHVSTHIRHIEFNWSNLNNNIPRSRESMMANVMINQNRGRFIHYYNIFDEMPHYQENQRMHVPFQPPRRDSFHDLIQVLNEFKNLYSMKMSNVFLERDGEAPPMNCIDNLSSLRELSLTRCDEQCFKFLTSCNQLSKVTVSNPLWYSISESRNPGVESFENFLIRQDELKYLRFQNYPYTRFLQDDRSPSINFRLHHLILNNVFFKDMNNAEKFFRTQNQIQSISLHIQNEKSQILDERLFYNNILKILFMNNPSLQSVNIDKNKYKMENVDFLANIQSANVKNLTFKVTAEDKEVKLFKAIIAMCPNLVSIHFRADESEDTDSNKCFDVDTNLDKLESLTIINSQARSLINLYAENLINFEYVPGKTGEYIDDFIGGFLHRHRTIKNLVIGCENGRHCSYFFVSYNLCQLIVNFLPHLESISIFNFAEVNKSVKLLCTLSNLKSLTLSSVQHQQFTAKTKIECNRMKIKLIPVPELARLIECDN